MKKTFTLSLFIVLLAMGSINVSLAQGTGIFDKVTFDTIATSSFPYRLDKPRDLDFHPTSSDQFELWVLNRGSVSTGSTVTIISDAGQSAQDGTRKKDGNAWHFMSLSTAIAFAENGNFATSPGIRDANHGSGGSPGFTGPALWSGNQSVFAISPPGKTSSHLDMLHSSPYALGICHEPGTGGILGAGNIFWVFDGSPNADIARYDFGADHGPGNADHSGASVQRYKGLGLTGQVLGTPESEVAMPPSHMVIDPSSGWLYACHTKGKRIIRLNTDSTDFKNFLTPPYGEGHSEYAEYTIDMEVFVDSGLTSPCGVDIIGSRLYVSDYSTGEIIAYNINSKEETGRLQTAPGIMGLKTGPDGNLWYVNATDNELVRVSNIKEFAVGQTALKLSNKITVYPIPSSGRVSVILGNGLSGNSFNITVTDILGRAVYNETRELEYRHTFDFDKLSKGIYTLTLANGSMSQNKKFIID